MYITLMDGAGNEVLSKRLKMDLNTDAAQLFIGVLCDEPERLSYLEQVGVNYSMLRTKTIDLSVYDLPDTELGLDQLDVLLITDFNSETLTEEQTEAIWEWVHRGGILLFGTGARGDETLSAFSKQLLEYPVSPGMVYEIQMGQDRTAREPGKIFFPGRNRSGFKRRNRPAYKWFPYGSFCYFCRKWNGSGSNF